MKGLLFVPEMAVAVCEDRKTVTRRVITYPVPQIHPSPPCNPLYNVTMNEVLWKLGEKSPKAAERYCDYQPGERRCLLTTWAVGNVWDEHKPLDIPTYINFWHAGLGTPKPDWAGKSRPGRFLPNSARHLMPVFEIASVNAERVQDITEEDAIREGIEPIHDNSGLGWPCGWKDYQNPDSLPFDHAKPKASFKSLWDSINADRKDEEGKRLPYSWADNPWVWRVEFRRVKP